MTTWDAEVAIVGAGIAGATAALELGKAGVPFIGIEAAPEFGGTAARGGGGIAVPGSPMQAAAGISDTPEIALADLLRDNPDADTVWASRYFEAAAREVYGFIADLGIAFGAPRAMEGDSRNRWHGPEGLGRAVMARLWDEGCKVGFASSWRFGWRCTDLVVDGPRVVGIVLLGPDGRTETLHAPNVIFCTGGFAGDRDLSLRYAPHFAVAERFLAAGGPGATGEGQTILARRGAALTHTENVYAYATAVPDYRDPARQRALIALGVRDWVWLNAEGKRFHDETRTGYSASLALLNQPKALAWAIFDSAMQADLLVNDHYQPPGTETRAETARRYLRESPDVVRADTLGELLKRCGLPEAAESTLADWNAALASEQADDETGRPLAGLRRLAEPPFLALPLGLAARKCLGGVKTDGACQVLDTAGAPIPGLYAAGEIAGMAGGHMIGRIPHEGMMFGGCLYSGRVAGRAVARCAPCHATAGKEVS